MIVSGCAAEEIVCDLRGVNTVKNISSRKDPEPTPASLSISIEIVKDGVQENVRRFDFNFIEGDFDKKDYWFPYAQEHEDFENFSSVVDDRIIKVFGFGVSESFELKRTSIRHTMNEFALSINRFSGKADFDYDVYRTINVGPDEPNGPDKWTLQSWSILAEGDCGSFEQRKF